MNFNFSKSLLRKNTLSVALNSVKKPTQERKHYDDAMTFFNLTTHDVYEKLMPFEYYIPKMDPEFIPNYMRMVKKREMMLKPSIYPLYMRTPFMRIWYRTTWLCTILMMFYSFSNIYYIISNN